MLGSSENPAINQGPGELGKDQRLNTPTVLHMGDASSFILSHIVSRSPRPRPLGRPDELRSVLKQRKQRFGSGTWVAGCAVDHAQHCGTHLP
ncbi:MAG: hypothetical protein ACR2HK_14995, partial [Gemmatimonadales bacterium]